MKNYLTFFIFLIFFTQGLFGQFKNTFAPNGNPTSQIIDASGMKQGSWNYYDVNDQIFRIETYTDNVLTKNTYLINGSEINMTNYQNLQLSELRPEAVDFIIKTLQPFGKGEIIFHDGIVQVYFYYGKLKKKVPSDMDLSTIKKLKLENSLIKF